MTNLSLEGTGLTEAYEVVRTIGFKMPGKNAAGKDVVFDTRLDVIFRLNSKQYELMMFTMHPTMPTLLLQPLKSTYQSDTPEGVISLFMEKARTPDEQSQK